MVLDSQTQKKSCPLKNSSPKFSPSGEPDHTPSLLGDIIMGLRFFSRLPTGGGAHQNPQMARLVPGLGLSSLIIGLLPALVFVGAGDQCQRANTKTGSQQHRQAQKSGAMAEDGLADSFDGLFGGHSPAQRLEIMKDSTQGTYGVLALALLTITRIVALGTLASGSMIGAAMLWISAQIIARQSALWIMVALPSARKEGTATSTGTLGKRPFIIGAVIAGLIVFVLAGMFVGIGGLLLAGIVMALIVLYWTGLCKNLIGGYSGDLIGALHALVEIGVLCTFIILI